MSATIAPTRIVEVRVGSSFVSLEDFCRRTRLGRRAVEALIWTGAFDRWGRARKQLFGDLEQAQRAAAPSSGFPLVAEGEPVFDQLSGVERLSYEMAYSGVSACGHASRLVAKQLEALQAATPDDLAAMGEGARVVVGDVVVARQQPPTAGGIVFLSVETADGIVNVVVRPDVWEMPSGVGRSDFLAVEGHVQHRHGATSVLAHRLIPLQPSTAQHGAEIVKGTASHSHYGTS